MNSERLSSALIGMLERKESGLNEFDKMLLNHKRRKDRRNIKHDKKVAMRVKAGKDSGKEIPMWIWYMDIKSVHTMKNLVLYCFE